MIFPARSAIAWLLAVTMPFQALLAVYLDVRGPGHYHIQSDIAANDHGQAHVTAHLALAHGHSHVHGEQAVEHHHHHRADPTVVTVQNSCLSSPLLARSEDIISGW